MSGLTVVLRRVQTMIFLGWFGPASARGWSRWDLRRSRPTRFATTLRLHVPRQAAKHIPMPYSLQTVPTTAPKPPPALLKLLAMYCSSSFNMANQHESGSDQEIIKMMPFPLFCFGGPDSKQSAIEAVFKIPTANPFTRRQGAGTDMPRPCIVASHR